MVVNVEKNKKRRQFSKIALYLVSWNSCSNKVNKPLALLVKEDFLLDILVSDDRTQWQYQKTVKKALNGPKNVIFYMCRMTHCLDIGYYSFCLWNVIFNEDSIQIIHMVG